MSASRRIPLEFQRRDPLEMVARAREFEFELGARRSVREFSDVPVPAEVLDACIAAASSAPSGAHCQPWTFAVVTDGETKRRIRAAAEAEERLNYAGRMGAEWLHALEPFGTDEHKPFLERAPALIAVFRQAWGWSGERKVKHYYTQESVGIAVGFLLAALHHAGVAALTHTPSPMGFLERILERPPNERAYVLIPVGFPEGRCTVPDLRRKELDRVRVWIGPR